MQGLTGLGKTLTWLRECTRVGAARPTAEMNTGGVRYGTTCGRGAGGAGAGGAGAGGAGAGGGASRRWVSSGKKRGRGGGGAGGGGGWKRRVPKLFEPPSASAGALNIAVQGCCHSQLNDIYHHLQTTQTRTGIKVDLLLINGDIQAFREKYDLDQSSIPGKYRRMGDFVEYYEGKRRAPVLTVVIGGNHEASNYFSELYFGGWLAPNIYYLGQASVLTFASLRLAGLSGIYKPHDYPLGHHEVPPYTPSTKKSVYHVRRYDCWKLMHVMGKVDIGLSHDWPNGVVGFGDEEGLLKEKPFFRDDLQKGELGSDPAMTLLKTLKPDAWFSAHLHCCFEAIIRHSPQRPAPATVLSGYKKPPESPGRHAFPERKRRRGEGSAGYDGGLKRGTVGAVRNPEEIQIEVEFSDMESEKEVPEQDGRSGSGELNKAAPSRERGHHSGAGSLTPNGASGSVTNGPPNASTIPNDDTAEQPLQTPGTNPNTTTPPLQHSPPHTPEPQPSNPFHHTPNSPAPTTRFLALDKIQPKRPSQHLHVFSLPVNAKEVDRKNLYLDVEWLAITRAAYAYFPFDRDASAPPDDIMSQVATERSFLEKRFASNPELLKLDQSRFKRKRPEDYQFVNPPGGLEVLWKRDPQTRWLLGDILGLDGFGDSS